jgi:hypothetical protein
MTGIPAGSISHYFSRFNKNPRFYRENAGTQDPPRSSVQDHVTAVLLHYNVLKKVSQHIMDDEFDKARDVLLFVLLFMEFEKRVTPIIKNADPDNFDEFVKETMKIIAAFS